MNEIFEKIYNDNNTDLNESTALFEKVYTEAEMLNEMNPKLRALLAAGLIGTASLGAASCSMPTDDPTIYEQPAPETPANPDNPNPDEPGDTEEVVTFETLGVADYAESLARTRKIGQKRQLTNNAYTNLIYKNGFVPVEFENNQYEDGQTYTHYVDPSDRTSYYVPVSMENDFDAAIVAYKAAHAE